MSPKDPYADSVYDAAGMPLGTTTADYDNAEDRRKNQVKTREVKPESINDIDYTPPVTEADTKFQESRKPDPAKFNGMVDTSKVTDEDDLFLEEETPKEKGDDSVPDPKKEEKK